MNNKVYFALAAVFVMAGVSLVPMASEFSDAATTAWSPDFTYTITLNQTTNSSAPITLTLGGDLAGKTAITAGDAGDFNFDSTGHGPFYSYYALFDNEGNELGMLNPNDLSEYMDGTAAPITTNNVMWVIPTVYWSVSNDGMTLTLSSDPEDGIAYAHTVDGTVWKYLAIGVYEGTSTGTYNSSASNGADTFTSYSGKSPRVGAMREVMRAEAAGTFDDGQGYKMLWNFYQWDLFRFAVMATTGTYYSQSIFGAGAVSGVGLSAGVTTGGLNAVGPYSNTGSAASASGVKAFIENPWGSVNEFVDDCVWWPDGTNNSLYLGQNAPDDILDKYKANDSANKNSEHARDNKTSVYQVTASASGIATGVTTANASVWGYPSVGGGSGAVGTTANFSVPAPSNSNALLVCVGGYFNSSVDYAGLSYAGTSTLNYADTNYGSRLAFVFGADAAPTTDVTITLDETQTGYGTINGGTVDIVVTGVEEGSAITISTNTLTVGSTTITASPASATAQFTYAFDGFYDGLTKLAGGELVTTDMEITAKFTATVNEYTLTFQSSNTDYGTVSAASVADLPYGTQYIVDGNTVTIGQISDPAAVITATPAESTAAYVYTFDSWSADTGMVTGDLTITATFSQDDRYYTVIVTAGDGGSLAGTTEYSVPYGTVVSVNGSSLSVGGSLIIASPDLPDAQYTYAFDKWVYADESEVQNEDVITAATEVTALFSSTVNTYTVTIGSNDPQKGSVDVSTVSDVPYGTPIVKDGATITVGETTITATAATGQEFSSWSAPSTVTGDTTITANFDEPTDTNASLLKLVPLFVIIVILMAAAAAILRSDNMNASTIVTLVIGIAVMIIVVSTLLIPSIGGF